MQIGSKCAHRDSEPLSGHVTLGCAARHSGPEVSPNGTLPGQDVASYPFSGRDLGTDTEGLAGLPSTRVVSVGARRMEVLPLSGRPLARG